MRFLDDDDEDDDDNDSCAVGTLPDGYIYACRNIIEEFGVAFDGRVALGFSSGLFG